MKALAIDTATDSLSVAAGDDAAAAAESVLDAGRSHLELLLPEALRLLESNGLTLSDLEAIAVGTGPGTFSGLRVGVATARALAQALQIPISGSSTLEALALEIAGDPACGSNDILPLIDAKRSQVFAQIFKRADGGGIKPASEIMCSEPERLLRELKRNNGRRFLAAGNGCLAYYEMFAGSSMVSVLERESIRHKVRASWHLKSLPGKTAFSPEDLMDTLPVYVRQPDADRTVELRKRGPWL